MQVKSESAPYLAFVMPSTWNTSAPTRHRHALRVGFLEAQAHVFIGEPRREAEVERAGQDGARELVLRRGVAAAAGVDDVAHLPRVQARLRAHRDDFRRHHDDAGRDDVVRELHDLREARAFAAEEQLAELLDRGLDAVVDGALARDHDGERAVARAGHAAADGRVHIDDAGLRELGVRDARDAAGPSSSSRRRLSVFFASVRPAQTFCTMSGVGRLRNATSVLFATSSAEPATCAPSFASSAVASFDVSYTVRLMPALSRRRAMCAPMRPTPMNP